MTQSTLQFDAPVADSKWTPEIRRKIEQQTAKVRNLMSDQQYRSLPQIVAALGSMSESSASARLRDCRKLGYIVDRRFNKAQDLFEYRVRGGADVRYPD